MVETLEEFAWLTRKIMMPFWMRKIRKRLSRRDRSVHFALKDHFKPVGFTTKSS